MPATWSFDTMKRYSTLDTLEEEGANPNGQTNGEGLYKYIEKKNDKIIADAKNNLDDYKNDADQKLDDFEADMRKGGNPSMPKLNDPPKIAEAEKIPGDLSGYVTFLHPWMHEIVNQFVLIFMFFGLVITTLIILRLKDIK